jgi:hypothetical protein
MKLGILHFMAHRYERAIAHIKRSATINEAGHAYPAASCALLNQVEDARVHAAALFELHRN